MCLPSYSTVQRSSDLDADYKQELRQRDVRTHLKAATTESRVLHDMERAPQRANLWILVQTVAWIVALEGVAEFFSERHSHALFRRLVALLLDRDPFSPRLPDNWEEWYNA